MIHCLRKSLSSFHQLRQIIIKQWLWFSLCTFRIFPVVNLSVEANEPSLENRHIKFGMQYEDKFKVYPSHFDYVRLRIESLDILFKNSCRIYFIIIIRTTSKQNSILSYPIPILWTTSSSFNIETISIPLTLKFAVSYD
jgi:hypothetical protein